MRTLAVAAGLLAASLVPALLPGPAGAAPETTVGFGLPRGPAVSVPHVEGQTVVDGAVRVPVDADYVFYLGRAGSSYVVEAIDQDGQHGRIERVAPDGTVTRLAVAYGYPTHVSADGQQLVTTRQRRSGASTVTVRSATTGAPLVRRTFRGPVLALDLVGDRVLLGGSKRTMVWHTATGTFETLSRDEGYVGSLAADVVAVFDRSTRTDEGACTRILRVTTGRTLTTMCDDLVLTFNDDASRMATTFRYLDGPISVIKARSLDGRVLGQYRSTRGTALGGTRWETRTRLLVGVDGPHRTGTARCTGTRCELAGRPLKTS